jgi:hypothetical protein
VYEQACSGEGRSSEKGKSLGKGREGKGREGRVIIAWVDILLSKTYDDSAKRFGDSLELWGCWCADLWLMKKLRYDECSD